jgi:hypothetical protein
VSLPISRYDGRSVSAALAPRPAVIDQPASLVVQLVVQSVDPTGLVRGTPVVGATMQLSGSGDWRVRTENPSITDSNGQATFQVVCQTTGSQPLGATIDGQYYDLKLPDCSSGFVESTTTDPSVRTTPTTRRTTSTTR